MPGPMSDDDHQFEVLSEDDEKARALYAADQLKIMKNPSGSLAREYLRLVAFLEEQEKKQTEQSEND